MVLLVSTTVLWSEQKRYSRPEGKKGHTRYEALEYMKDCAASLAKHFKAHPKWGRLLAIDIGQYGSLGIRQLAHHAQNNDCSVNFV